MRANALRYPGKAFSRVLVFACLGFLVTVALLYFLVRRPKPPDLTGCTHVEIRYEDGALNQLLPGSTFQEHLLDQQERDYVRSYDKWSLADHQRIDALAQNVSKGVYGEVARGPVAGYGIGVTGYGKGATPATFVMYKSGVIDNRHQVFSSSVDLTNLPAIEPPGIKTLKTRWDCALNLAMLETERLLRGRHNLHLDPNHWCDDLVESFHLHDRNDEVIAKIFACPSVHRAVAANGTHLQASGASLPGHPARVRTSDYAMNSYCEPNSPRDVVFLFEAKPGWNQHGGPELFTFDNHDRKGGRVKLNDGTTKFIRTKEELAQLRRT
jgi:hypothetical protein